MSVQNSFTDLVFSLSDKNFKSLQNAVAVRKNKEQYGVTSFEELALRYNRIPTCPSCGSGKSVSFGFFSGRAATIQMFRMWETLHTPEQYNLPFDQ